VLSGGGAAAADACALLPLRLGGQSCHVPTLLQARRTSLMSITAVVDAWGAIVLEASKPFTTS